jgi:mRNA-degrading endonuclease HigB of HigAB toxin-antitoxin module
MHWYLVAKRARWQSLVDVREDFRQVIYVRHVLTHAEYSKEKWKS